MSDATIPKMDETAVQILPINRTVGPQKNWRAILASSTVRKVENSFYPAASGFRLKLAVGGLKTDQPSIAIQQKNQSGHDMERAR
jgi:hypothetical protein